MATLPCRMQYETLLHQFGNHKNLVKCGCGLQVLPSEGVVQHDA